MAIDRVPDTYFGELANILDEIERLLIEDDDPKSKRLYEILSYLRRKSVQMNAKLYSTDIINFTNEITKRKKKTLLKKQIKLLNDTIKEQARLVRLDDEAYTAEMKRLGRTVQKIREPKSISRR